MSCDTSSTIDCHVIHHLPMHGHVMSYITYQSCHVMWYITYHRCMIMVMSYDSLPTIDACSFHMIHHLPSMHGHVKWYITYHRRIVMLGFITLHLCVVMSYDTSPTNHTSMLLYFNYLRCMVMSYDTSCRIISYDTSMDDHVIWYITYHPYIDVIILHLPSMHGHVI